MTFLCVSLPEARMNGEALYRQLGPSRAVNESIRAVSESMLYIIGIAPAFTAACTQMLIIY